jgi:integrase
MILFSELCEMELVETNPVRDIKKKKTIKHLRTVLTDQERLLVNDFLKINHPSFHRFLHIFFHSGARISELIQLKASDIDLSRQRYKIIIQKGREYREVWKVIKNIALPFWINLLEKAKVNDYVFSVGLEPGVAQIQSYQITKRWYRLVKKKLNIEADFYSLKHLNLDETASILDINDASVMASHNSTSITSKYYALGEKQRQTERLKSITNKFA